MYRQPASTTNQSSYSVQIFTLVHIYSILSSKGLDFPQQTFSVSEVVLMGDYISPRCKEEGLVPQDPMSYSDKVDCMG